MIHKHNMTENMLAIGWMLLAVLLFSGLHTLIRIGAETIPALELAFFRNFFGAILLIPVLMKYGLAPLKTTKLKLFGWRAILNGAAMSLFFSAVASAPLADVTALSFLGPIFATVLAVFIVKEKVGWQRWAAILTGFLGALIIIRPGFSEINLGVVQVIIASALWAGALVIIKILSRTESSMTITLYMTLLLSPITLIPALFVWVWPTGMDWILLLMTGLLGNMAQYCMSEGLRMGDTHVVMPMDYTRLIWLSIIGWFMFSEIPDFYTIIGGGIIAGSAIFIAWRESKKHS